MPGINTNVTNNKKNIILKTKKNNIWLFKSDSEISIESSIYVNNNFTKEILPLLNLNPDFFKYLFSIPPL